MSTDTLALMERLQSASTLDWRATRDEIHELHKRATTSHERGALLAIYTAVMDQVERSGTITDMAEFKEARQQDYNLFLIREATDEAGNIVPETLLAATEREIADGRMTETDELHRLARAGIMTLTPGPPQPSLPPPSSWWDRLRSLLGL